MKKLIFTLILLMLISPISAEILLTQPDELYSLGDVVTIPVTIKTASDISDFLTLNLICGGIEQEFYREYILIDSGDEKKISPSIILIPETIGKLAGQCKVKAILGEDFVLTNEFKISEKIELTIETQKQTLKPGTSFFLEGEAIKENQKGSDGIIELEFLSSGKKYIESITKGYFSFNISIPENIPAGEHSLSLNAYEIDKNQEQTNKGIANYLLTIEQVPKNLEIFFENEKVTPGTNLKVKTILHDQSGENIPTISIITIKNSRGKMLTQEEIQTDEFLEYPIEYKEPASTWQIYAISSKLESEAEFTILEIQEIDISIINNTLLIKNSGNTQYNKSVIIKIGNETLNLDLDLKVDGETKYSLTAPDGEYQVEVLTDGENRLSENVFLTGNVIDANQVSDGIASVIRHPFVWFFMIGIFGFVAFMVVRKGYQRTFIGKIHLPSLRRSNKTSGKQTELINSTNKAELSLSIKGDKQNSSIICIKIKNKKQLENKKQGIEETIKKINQIAENNKASIYENNDYIFLILAPINTKTFKNQKRAVEISEKILALLESHNRLLKEKIDFGISVNDGYIVAKKEKDSLKFMSMGNFLGSSKKTASTANKTILLTPEINEKLRSDVKTEKKTINNLETFTIKEIKKKNPETEKFIGNFVKKMEDEFKSKK